MGSTNRKSELPDANSVRADRDTPPPTPWVRHNVCACLGFTDSQVGHAQNVQPGNTVMHMTRHSARHVETMQLLMVLDRIVRLIVCAMPGIHLIHKPNYAKLESMASTNFRLETRNVMHVHLEAQRQSWARWHRVVALRMWVISPMQEVVHSLHVPEAFIKMQWGKHLANLV